MMAVVLVNPPAAAQPDSQVAEQDAGDIAGPAGAENLPVPGVVAQEPDLGEDHRQEHGHRELPPRVARHDEDGPSGGQHPDGEGDLPGVVARPPLQQPGFLDLPRQLRVLAAAARRRRCGGQLDLPAHGRCCVGRSHRELLEAHRDRAGNVPARSWAAAAGQRSRRMHRQPRRYPRAPGRLTATWPESACEAQVSSARHRTWAGMSAPGSSGGSTRVTTRSTRLS